MIIPEWERPPSLNSISSKFFPTRNRAETCCKTYAAHAFGASTLSMPSMLSMIYPMMSIHNYTRTAGHAYKHVACLGPLGLGSRLWRGLVEMLPGLSIWHGLVGMRPRLNIPPSRLPPLRLPTARLPLLGRLGLHARLPCLPWKTCKSVCAEAIYMHLKKR